MFEFIIDLFKAIFKSIFGDSQQRKTAGAVAFLTLLAITFGAFTAWVSQPRYKDILFGLTDGHAWAISIAIACGMSFGITKLSYDLYRSIQTGRKLPSNFVPLLILILLVGTFDCVKNFEGSEDRARFSTEIDKYANGTEKPYVSEIAKLEAEKKQILRQYTWKGNLDFRPKPYSRHTASTHRMHKDRMNQIEGSIKDYENKQTAEINEYNSLREERNRYGKKKSDKAHTGLWWMSLSVYFLQIIIGYFLVGAMDELDGERDGELSFGKSNRGIISALKEKFSPSPATAEKESGQIGFKTVKPETLEPEKLGNSAGENGGILREILRGIEELKSGENERGKGVANSPGFRPAKSTHVEVQKSTVDLGNSAPEFSRVNQPTEYRGIKEKEYRKFLRVAQEIRSHEGRYNRTAIARKWLKNEDRKKVGRYLKAAFERGDLKNE